MAETMNTALNAIDWGGVGQGVAQFFTWTLLIILIVGLIWFAWYWFSFKNTYELREVSNNRKIVGRGRWKVIRDKKGNRWFVTRFYNRLFGRIGLKKSMPPEAAIELNKRGSKHVLGWRLADSDTIIWAADTFTEKRYKDEKGTAFQPLDTAEREMLVREIEKAESYEGKNLSAIVMQVVLIAAPIILIAVIALTIGDVTEALGDLMQEVIDPLDKLVDQMGRYTDTLKGVQVVNSSTPAVTPPPG